MTNIIGDVVGIGEIVNKITESLTNIITNVAGNGADEFWQILEAGGKGNTGLVESVLAKQLDNFDKDLGRLILQPLIEGTMAVDYGKLQVDSAGAISTLEGAVGFSLVLDAFTEGIDAVIKTILGDRAPEFILDTIRKIPNAVGMEYFLGITLANVFERAVGTPLEEAINIQTLPARIDIQVLRQLLRQHKISTEEADTYRAKLGYRDSDWQLILEMGAQLLTIGDLGILYQYGELTSGEFASYLQAQGYTDSDIALLEKIYIIHAESTGGSVYRQVARTAYMENAISSAQFTEILTQANVPDKSIKLELAGLNLEKKIGAAKLSPTLIRDAYGKGDITLAEVKTRLADDGYKLSDIELILKEWNIGPYSVKVTTTAKTVLRYYKSGIITHLEAQHALAQIGITPDAVTNMLDNPDILGSGYIHQLSPATILAAYKDGVMSVDAAQVKLESVGVAPNEALLELKITEYQLAHKKMPKSATKGISEAEIKAAFDEGLVTETWAIRELMNFGYGESDANLIVVTWITKLSGSIPNGWKTLH